MNFENEPQENLPDLDSENLDNLFPEPERLSEPESLPAESILDTWKDPASAGLAQDSQQDPNEVDSLEEKMDLYSILGMSPPPPCPVNQDEIDSAMKQLLLPESSASDFRNTPEFKATTELLFTALHPQISMRIIELSHIEAISPRMSLMSALATVSALLAGRVTVEYRGRRHPLVLQVIASAPSLAGKSTCFEEFAVPLKSLLSEAKKAEPHEVRFDWWQSDVTSAAFLEAVSQNPTGAVAIMDGEGRKLIRAIQRGALSPLLKQMLMKGARGKEFCWKKYKREINVESLKVSVLLLSQWDRTLELVQSEEAGLEGLLGRIIFVNGNPIGGEGDHHEFSTNKVFWASCLKTLMEFVRHGAEKRKDLNLQFHADALKLLNQIRKEEIDSPYPVRSAEITLKLAAVINVLWKVCRAVSEDKPYDLCDEPIQSHWVEIAHKLFLECHETHLEEVRQQIEAPFLAEEEVMIGNIKRYLELNHVILKKDAGELGFSWDALAYYGEKYPNVFRIGTFKNPEGGRPPNGIALNLESGAESEQEGGDGPIAA